MWLHDKKEKGFFYEERVKDRAGRTHILTARVKDSSRRAKKEAQEELRKKIEEFDDSFDKRLTLSMVVDIYNKEQMATLRPSTCARNSCTLRTIIGILGDVEMNKLTAGYIRARLIDTGKGAGTINQYIKRFKGFLRWAYQYDYLDTSDVYEKLSYLKDTPHRLKIQDKFLEPEELRALLDEMEVPRWKLLTEFLALSGLRIGEALALDERDVSENYIHVYKSVQINHGHQIGDTKTVSSNREVFIQPELKDCIDRIRLVNKEQAAAVERPDSNCLFVSLDGSRAHYNAYVKYLKKCSQKSLGRVIGPHTLRHTHTSILAAQGVPFDTISRRLGHENSQITRDIYFHITRGLRISDASKISKVSILAVTDAVTNPSTPHKIRHVQ